jgi:hypothetical protein
MSTPVASSVEEVGLCVSFKENVRDVGLLPVSICLSSSSHSVLAYFLQSRRDGKTTITCVNTISSARCDESTNA